VARALGAGNINEASAVLGSTVLISRVVDATMWILVAAFRATATTG